MNCKEHLVTLHRNICKISVLNNVKPMSDSIKSTIIKRLEKSPEHSVFFLGDFTDLCPVETARKVLLEACMAGIISRLSHGIYIKPMNSRFGEVPPPLEKVAYEIAERDHVKIMPTGDTAANIIGLSTQVPMVVSYLTSGSSRSINIGRRQIKFRHAAPRNFAYKGNTIPLIVQALKGIGADNINDRILYSISAYLDKAKDSDTFGEDVLLAPAWIQTIIRPLIIRRK